MRLIDADHLTMLVNSATILSDGFKNAFCKLVDGEPTVNTTTVRHGRWMGRPLCGNANCPCSECGSWHNIHANLRGEVMQKYCPTGGACMDADESESR